MAFCRPVGYQFGECQPALARRSKVRGHRRKRRCGSALAPSALVAVYLSAMRSWSAARSSAPKCGAGEARKACVARTLCQNPSCSAGCIERPLHIPHPS